MAGFNVKKFRNPSGDSHPGYFWVTSSEMTESLMMEQLHDMCNRGAKSVCLHPSPKNWSKVSRMEPDYLSGEYLQLIGKIVDECKKLGMNYYFYDEGGYPSGSAAGEVYASDPERFAPTHLVKNPETGKIIDKESYERLSKLASHGRLICGGEKLPEELKISPTVIDMLDENDPLLTEEISGPLLPVGSFSSEEDLICKLKKFSRIPASFKSRKQ